MGWVCVVLGCELCTVVSSAWGGNASDALFLFGFCNSGGRKNSLGFLPFFSCVGIKLSQRRGGCYIYFSLRKEVTGELLFICSLFSLVVALLFWEFLMSGE